MPISPPLLLHCNSYTVRADSTYLRVRSQQSPRLPSHINNPTQIPLRTPPGPRFPNVPSPCPQTQLFEIFESQMMSPPSPASAPYAPEPIFQPLLSWSGVRLPRYRGQISGICAREL
ncbi:uncharacterized protein STEHIDRAFT_149722 [Stereum hirsutum FP-91666 SS1]|uniref:uncharacterized protein n=1 Tax=Stereum hirsutum (strain FP-91666) TaxID=721885 RepID=UPI0004449F98|nr:uncharacterized protein STEHIDRAFT_149722 [Stereum hirsutum FP-91666 SS1]EIM82012.1 hypothetical protein STEHIDRAFT_149722 [Stereum hirsutum FP-91666 SS1]